MENDFTMIEALAAIISLISLVCFFVLCNNVRLIKKELIKSNDIRDVYVLYKMGKVEQAHDLLEKAFWQEIYDTNTFSNETKAKWKHRFKIYGFERIDLDTVELNILPPKPEVQS